MATYDDDLRLAHVLADAVERITMSRFRAEDLSVVTAVPDSTGRVHIVALPTARRFSQGGGFHRLVLHFSIGEAY